MPYISADARIPLLEGFGTLTVNVLYGFPDYPDIVQEFIWQTGDVHPHFPRLRKFMNFWLEEIDGPVHKLTIAHAKLLVPQEVPVVDGKLMLN